MQPARLRSTPFPWPKPPAGHLHAPPCPSPVHRALTPYFPAIFSRRTQTHAAGSFDLSAKHPHSHMALRSMNQVPCPFLADWCHDAALLHATCGHVHDHRISVTLPPVRCVSKLHSPPIVCVSELHCVVTRIFELYSISLFFLVKW